MTIKIQNETQVFNNKVVVCYMTAIIDASSSKNKMLDGMTITSKGTAICHEDDVFDVVVGKKLAYKKAKTVVYDKLNNILDRLMLDIEDFKGDVDILKLDIEKRYISMLNL